MLIFQISRADNGSAGWDKRRGAGAMKRIDLLVRGLMVVLVAAFVMRPVVVSVHNGTILSGTPFSSQHLSDASPVSQLASAKTAFHSIAKEYKDFATRTPCFTRGMVPAEGGRPLSPTTASGRTFPQSFLILRI